MAKVSWMWKGKRYSGTLIRETKTHKFARTKNGKIMELSAACGSPIIDKKPNTPKIDALIEKFVADYNHNMSVMVEEANKLAEEE